MITVQLKECSEDELKHHYSFNDSNIGQTTTVLACIMDPQYKPMKFLHKNQCKVAEDKLESKLTEILLKQITTMNRGQSVKSEIDFLIHQSLD